MAVAPLVETNRRSGCSISVWTVLISLRSEENYGCGCYLLGARLKRASTGR